MGNQGTTNWKLTAFFAISLMLIAGLFSNAAIAGNGDGTITVGWSTDAANVPDDSRDNAGDDSNVVTDPLAAGSTGNALKFTYTVPSTISMAGGKLEIAIPAGWKPLKIAADDASTTDLDETTLYRSVSVTVDIDGAGTETATPVYTTTETARTLATTDELAASHGTLALSDTKIEFTLGSTWFNGGTLVITLGNVQTDIPSSLRVAATTTPVYPAYTAYPFEARSMERNGRLVRLRPSTDNPQPQPRVNVGNILGLRTEDADADNTTRDLTKRVIDITPATSYPGEKYNYIATFTAPGPMYDATLLVTFPADAATGLETEGDDRFTVRAPGAALGNRAADPVVPAFSVSGRAVTVNLTRINKDQKVTITLHDATVGASAAATVAPAVTAFPITASDTATTIPSTGTATALTTIKGGAFALIPGSGKIVASPDNAKAKASISRLTITYTAATALEGAGLRITIPEGIMASAKTGEVDDDGDTATPNVDSFRLQATNSSMRGYVTSPDSKGAAPDIAHASATSVNGTPTTITWNSVTLAKDKTFRTYINGVKVQDEGARLMITAQLIATGSGTYSTATPPDDAVNADGARFYVIVTENEDVTFTANKDRLRAASLDTVEFTFTADDTPIRNGRVQFNIPSGWSQPMKGAAADTDVIGSVTVGGTAGARFVEDLSVSNRSITVAIPNADKGQTVTVTYGGTGKKAMIQPRAAEAVKINGYYWASSSSPRRGAGTVTIMVDNAKDGTGNGTITPTTVRAGSIEETFTIVYTAAGTMDGGQVSLEHPAGWGAFSSDPSTLNYVRVTASGGATIAETDNGGSIIIVTLDKCPPKGTITFVYGTGTGAQRGAKAQNNVDVASFMLKSQGDEFGTLTGVMGDAKKATVTDDDPKYLGATFSDADPVGQLRVDVTGADDGSGTAEVTLVKSKAGDQDYDEHNPKVAGTNEMRVHANDDATYIKIVYTATETIENGMLKFSAPAGWTKPQGSDPGEPGFTSVQGTGGASIDPESYATAATDLSLTVPITLINAGETIEIHYGETAGSGGGAMAPAASGAYRFTIDVKGGDSDDNAFRAITGTADGGPLEIMVYGQASGGGSAEVTAGDDNLTAGGSAQVTVVYTAAGDISNGMLVLTVPWDHPTMDNVDITSTGSIGAAAAGDFGGYYVGDPDDTEDDMEVPEGGPGAKEVHVDSVNLDAGETVTFVYSAMMVQAATGDATFGVKVDGGAGPGMGAMAVSAPEDGTLTVTVGEAAAGSGMAMVDLGGMAVVAGSMANELIFNYTAVGTIGYPREIRVTVPASWYNENEDDAAKGTYTVALADKDGRARANVVETLAAVGMDLVVRVRAGTATVNAGDVVSITYTAADAPRTTGNTAFKVLFDEMQVGSDLNVLVGSGKPATALTVSAPAMLLAESETPAMITVMLTDEDGNDAPAETDTVVSLSSSSSTGSFTVGGEAATTVTIMAGMSSAMAYYSDSSLGAATITASSGTLTAGMATINVTTEDVMVTSVSFAIADSDGMAKTVARDGDTVTVTAMGTQGQTAMVTIGTIVVSGSMEESATSPGTYTRSHTLAAGSPEGDHAVSVTIGSAMGSATAMLTVDNTAPTISAPMASPDTVANGDTVTISAMVSGATSVMANVSMLDVGAASVALADDGTGTYSGMHTISADNTAANGAQLITITAMDDAGNSADATASVMLQNAISFTSTLPQGISLFHVPLDEEGLDTVGHLETKLGDSVNLLITYDGTSWNSRSSDVAITASLGILVSMAAETTVTFEGQPWSDTMISVSAGSNLIGLPVNDPSVTMASQIGGLFAAGTVSSVIVASEGSFTAATAADDVAVAGDAGYLVIATAAGSATLTGAGWSNDAAGAAPIALAGYTVDNQTPVLDVHGSVVDEITGVAKEGFRVKVKNLSTKASLSEITSVETADGYNMTFVDLADSYAARVGDVLEISADSPSPLIGVQPVRHIVTVDDVKNGTLALENLIAYEIPAETELLRNYPNPFNPETWIPYHLSEDADVKLTIYDVNGEMVRDIDVGHQTAAKYDTRSKAIYWDGRNRFGEQVASGIYFYHLQAGDFSGTRKMVILK